MSTQNSPFYERVARIEARNKGRTKKNTRVLYEKRPDGLLVPTVVRAGRSFPWKSLVLAVVCLFGLKGFLYAQFGEDTLTSRVAELSAGKTGASVLAFVLQPDPVADWIAVQMAPFVPGTNPEKAEP